MNPSTMLHRDRTEAEATLPKAPSPPPASLNALRDANSGVPGRKDNGGLCRMCNRAGVCTFPRRESHPVLSCDEFDGASNATIATVALQRMDSPVAKATDRQSHPGLCGICDKRDSCTFPKPEGGVWHCDEFE